VNGCGQDHELRFYVWDGLAPNVRVAEGRDVCQWQYGAANSFRRVTKGLLQATLDPRYRHPVERIGARGLYGFSKADVLTVARWADNFILRLYQQPHEAGAMGGSDDPVEITEPYRRPPSTGGGGFLENLFDEKEGT
jgi:hypothetical protein